MVGNGGGDYGGGVRWWGGEDMINKGNSGAARIFDFLSQEKKK